MTKHESVSDVTERNVPEPETVCCDESGCSKPVSSSFIAAAFCGMSTPALLWYCDAPVVLAASAAAFASVYLLGRTLGLVGAVIGGMRKQKKYRVEYVSRHPFEEDRRLGYVSAEWVCAASRKGGAE